MFELNSLSIGQGSELFKKVFDWTSTVTQSIDRCGLSDRLYISTKDWGQIIVIHCGNDYYEGQSAKVAEVSSTLQSSEDFWSFLNDSGMLTKGVLIDE